MAKQKKKTAQELQREWEQTHKIIIEKCECDDGETVIHIKRREADSCPFDHPSLNPFIIEMPEAELLLEALRQEPDFLDRFLSKESKAFYAAYLKPPRPDTGVKTQVVPFKNPN